VEPQLYMWIGVRRRILRRHDFYVAQIRARVLSQFQDIEGEATRYADEEYDRLGSLPGDENSDMAVVAEIAHDRGLEFYMLLADLRKQTLLGALAGLYHQWDKDLRDFVEKELTHSIVRETAKKIAWAANVAKVFELLEQFGWNCRACPFFPAIDACRLIVNVYKHGKGHSLEDLARTYPEYLEESPGFDSTQAAFPTRSLDHEKLTVSQAQFEQIAGALRKFWEEFPERLFAPQC